MDKTDSVSLIIEQNDTDPTLRYYEDHAEEFTANTIDADMKDIRSRFLSHLPAGARILDFGCGTGRDTKAFLDLAYEVAALDGSPSLCRIAGEYTGIPVQCMDFREYSPAEEIYAVNRQYPLVSFRRIRQRYGLGPVRSCLVHHHHRNTVWPAVFQICRLIFLAVRKKDRIWRRSCFIYCKCNLVPAQWLVDGPRKFGNRMCVVHHHHWNSVRNTVFQDCETVPESVWGNYCS